MISLGPVYIGVMDSSRYDIRREQVCERAVAPSELEHNAYPSPQMVQYFLDRPLALSAVFDYERERPYPVELPPHGGKGLHMRAELL